MRIEIHRSELDSEVNQRIQSCLKLVFSLTRRWSDSLGRGALELEDLESVGLLGLIEAAERWDPSREKPFVNYAYQCIKFKITNALREENKHRGFWKNGTTGGVYKQIIPKWPDEPPKLPIRHDPFLNFHPYGLKDRELEIIEMTVLEDRPLKETARAFGLSEGHTCVLKREALAQLRRWAA